MPKRKKIVKRPRPAPDMREGKPATKAFQTALRQVLNPIPAKNR